MIKLFLTVTIAFLISGCIQQSAHFSSTPGAIRTGVSSFDNAKEVYMEPGWVLAAGSDAEAPMKLGLQWSSTSPEIVSFIAEVPGNIVNIISEKGLQFNVDGSFVALTSTQATTDFKTDYISGVSFMRSRKQFKAPAKLVERLVNADSVIVKLVTSEGYIEGNLKAPIPTSAIDSMPDFLAAIRTDS